MTAKSVVETSQQAANVRRVLTWIAYFVAGGLATSAVITFVYQLPLPGTLRLTLLAMPVFYLCLLFFIHLGYIRLGRDNRLRSHLIVAATCFVGPIIWLLILWVSFHFAAVLTTIRLVLRVVLSL